MTKGNRPPEFGSASYSFSVAEDATAGVAVGTVSATDLDGDSLTYAITAGNGDGKFAIDGGTGVVSVAGTLDYDTAASYALTVQADDGSGGTDTATVNISVTDVDGPGPLAGFTLVDAADQSVLASLTDGASVELADPDGGSYGVRADLVSGETVGSVSLELTGAKTVALKTENIVPYSLYGDYVSGQGRNLNGEDLPAGSYTLRAVAYSEGSLSGDKLGTLEISFAVTKAE